ncbi:GTP cyclohydrolase II [Oikeobacillus pervagus]|uniref:GTP cyclohydrolase II n=1 Tax=Oikeobacillus pervagus TaxID=1325931 RepID=A0AAJ1T1T4_9BACI|nr:hypothetical protein [Oikeobacillus pervagus]MDQ0215111.1 GTP cyclohydrolase II [Oikeobacillus pervagus]
MLRMLQLLGIVQVELLPLNLSKLDMMEQHGITVAHLIKAHLLPILEMEELL